MTRRPGRPVWVALGAALVLASAAWGVAGGLLRAGALAQGGAVVGRAAVWHAALMICCFMGGVIGVERALALKRRFAWAAPVGAAAAGIALLAGWHVAAALLLCAAAAVFALVNVVLVRRQGAAHTRLLLGAAIAWCVGNLLFALGDGLAALPWWFAFLVWTIAAERLEMTRLMRRRAHALPLFVAVLAAMAAGAALSLPQARAGAVLYGASLVGLAAWLLAFDITRVTIHTHGLARYMAVCLIAGYAWLAVAGLAWMAAAFGAPARDTALHALGLGFVVSMMMGHAPVILPAIARTKLLFGWPFYLPVAVLHLSLLARVTLGAVDAGWRADAAAWNAVSLVVFAATVAVAAVTWRLREPEAARRRIDSREH